MSRNAISEFAEHIVVEAGVDPTNLERRLFESVLLLSARHGAELIGTACLKRPPFGYRRNQFSSANVSQSATLYPLELDWITAHEIPGGIDCSGLLVDAALKWAFGVGVFAVARTDALRRLLDQKLFVAAGTPFIARQFPTKTMTLHLRPSLAMLSGRRSGAAPVELLG